MGDKSFFKNLLSYNLNLRRYAIIDPKAGEGKPKYAVRLNFRLSLPGIFRSSSVFKGFSVFSFERFV